MRTLTRALVAAMTLAAGCSSGGAGGEAEPAGPGGGTGADFGLLHDEAVALQRRHDDERATPAADLPASGSASYEGVVAYSTSEQSPSAILRDPDMVSMIDLEFDFADRAVEGSLHRFVDDDGVAASGELALVGSVSGGQVEAAARGTLTSGGSATSYSGGLEGEFVGDGGAAVVGTISLVAGTGDDSHRVFGTLFAE